MGGKCKTGCGLPKGDNNKLAFGSGFHVVWMSILYVLKIVEIVINIVILMTNKTRVWRRS
jgi:hypothetical protein